MKKLTKKQLFFKRIKKHEYNKAFLIDVFKTKVKNFLFKVKRAPANFAYSVRSIWYDRGCREGIITLFIYLFVIVLPLIGIFALL